MDGVAENAVARADVVRLRGNGRDNWLTADGTVVRVDSLAGDDRLEPPVHGHRQ